MAFRGWPVEALEFFEGLEADNSKSYWTAHKDTYDRLVLGPMQELVAELEPTYGQSKIFRPYRDVRFSKDKSPYKTNIAAVVGDGYIHLSAEGLGAGSGMWMMAPDQLERYRAAVAMDRTGKQLERIVKDAKAAGLTAEGHDMLKTAPKGYPKDHPRAELLKAKGLITWKDWGAGAWLGTRKARDRLVEFFEQSKPMNAWLRKNVGGSTMPERER
jgi:uncharacterized protein (TIGR02453 family)